jgi:O-antigen ligase
MNDARPKNRSEFFFATMLLLGYTVSLIVFSYREGFTMFAKLVGLMIVAYFGLRILKRGIDILLPLEYRFIFLWFLWAILASVFATNIDASIDKVITLIQVLLVSVAIFSVVVWQDSGRPYWTSFIIASIISSAITLANPSDYIGIDGRIAGTVGNSNLFSVVLNVGLAASITFSVTFPKVRYRPLFFGASVFLFYMIAETGSRKGMVGSMLTIFCVFLILAAYMRKQSTAMFVSVIAVGLILVVGAGTFLATSQHAERLEGLATAAQTGDASQGDNSLAIRAALIRRGIDQALEHPILGIGLDNFSSLRMGLIGTTGEYSHSNYIEILVSTGIPGLLLYVSMYVVLMSRLFALRLCIYQRDMVGPYAICVALVIVTTAFDFAMVSYYEKIQWLILSGVIAQVELLRRHVKQLSS